MSGPAANDATIPKHWYALTFIHGAAGTVIHGCVYLGYPNQLLTLPRIASAKEQAQMPPDAVLLNASYMGFATKEEITTP